MLIGKWKKELFTIPNLLSLFRIALLPIYITIYLGDGPRSGPVSGSILALSCFTDILDGQIARRFNMVTTLGKVLDPLADKITQFAMTLCLSLKYNILQPLLLLLLVKELFQVATGILFLQKGKMLPGALMAGKICTTVLFVSLTGLVLFPDVPPYAVKLIALTDGICLILSFACYISAYFGKQPKVQDLNAE